MSLMFIANGNKSGTQHDGLPANRMSPSFLEIGGSVQELSRLRWIKPNLALLRVSLIQNVVSKNVANNSSVLKK